MELPTVARAGAQLLGEVEETNLDEILSVFRRAAQPTAPTTETASVSRGSAAAYPILDLENLVARNNRSSQNLPLQIAGRYMPLVYKLVSALVTAPQRKAVVIIDVENRFDSTRIGGSGEDVAEDLCHVHIYRPSRCSSEVLRKVVVDAEVWMLYGHHESRAREWWGTIIVGSPFTAPANVPLGLGRAARVDVTASWRGWMRVSREELTGFPVGASAREALKDRDHRQDAVDAALWRATCQWGSFSFAEADGSTSASRRTRDRVDTGPELPDGNSHWACGAANDSTAV